MKAKLKKNWYGRIKNAEELHDDAKRWISEIDFINDELKFLNQLLSAKYIDFLEYGLESYSKDLQMKISDNKAINNSLSELIQKHLTTLSKLIDKDCVTSNTNYLAKHQKLEFEVEIYLQKYKKFKKQTFKIIERMLKKKEQKKLI